jgi:hypothetical protein
MFDPTAMRVNFHTKSKGKFARFEAFTAVKIQGEVLWVVTPYSVLVEY